MKEANFQTKFGKWLKENWNSTAVFELKLEKGKSFAFDKLKEHQIKALRSASEKGLYHKINDLPVYNNSKTRFANPKPFDCFYIQSEYAYLVIGFYTPRKKIETLFIDIEDFIKARSSTTKKSLKKEEWQKYARRVEVI